MNRAFASCFSATFQICPLSSIFLRRPHNAAPVSPDEPYGKAFAAKRPTIVINSLDSSHFLPGPYYEENKENLRKLSNYSQYLISEEINPASRASNRSPGDCYAARIIFTTQYITSKKTLIIKIRECAEMDTECFDSETLSQIRVLVPCAKSAKQQTAYTTGFHPVFEECLLFTNIEENDLLASKIRFRLYVKRGKNRPELMGETELRGKTVTFDGPPLVHNLKFGGPPKLEEEEFKNKRRNLPAIFPLYQQSLNIEHSFSSRSSRSSTSQHRVGSFKYAFQSRVNKAIGTKEKKREKNNEIERKVIESKATNKEVASQFTGKMPTTKHHRYTPRSLSPMLHRGSTSHPDSRRSSMVDACGRFCSQPTSDMPELLVSLCYYADHGRLIVGVERGSLPHKDGDTNRTPDTFVKVIAQAEYGAEIGKQKTETVKGSTEPRYDYSASFQIPQTELETTSIILQVWTWSGVLRRKSQIGWFALGLNSSSPDAQEHWSQMIQGLGTTVSKWHPILPPE